MSTLEITAPDGKTISITLPEGVTEISDSQKVAIAKKYNEGTLESKPAKKPESSSFFSEDVEKALFPTGGADISIPDSPFLEATAQTGLAALELADFPKRALGSIRSEFSMSDPESALLGPEAKKVEAFSKTSLDDKIQEFADAARDAEPGSFAQKGMLKRQRELQARKDEGKGTLALDTSAEIMRELPTLFIGGITKRVGKVIKNIIKGSTVAVDRVGSGISKLSAEAFAELKKKGGANTLQAAQGKALEIGEELKTLVIDQPAKYFPEREIVRASLKSMDDVPLKRVIDRVERVIRKVPLKDANQSTITKLEQIKNALANGREIPGSTINIPGKTISKKTTIPGSQIDIPGKSIGQQQSIAGTTRTIPGKEIPEVRDSMGKIIQPKSSTAPTTINIPAKTSGATSNIPGTNIKLPSKTIGRDASTKGTSIKIPAKKIVDQSQDAVTFKNNIEALDGFIDFSGAPGATLLNTQLKSIRSSMRRELIRTALKSKNPEYITAMKNWSKKEALLEKLQLKFGANGESFISSLFGKNKQQRREALDAVEAVFSSHGLKFKERARLTRLADEFEAPLEGKTLSRDFIETSPGEFIAGAPRGLEGGQGSPTSIIRGIGAAVSPDTAKRAVNLFEGIVKTGKLPAALANKGITIAQIKSILNFMDSTTEETKESSL